MNTPRNVVTASIQLVFRSTGQPQAQAAERRARLGEDAVFVIAFDDRIPGAIVRFEAHLREFGDLREDSRAHLEDHLLNAARPERLEYLEHEGAHARGRSPAAARVRGTRARPFEIEP